ncbi:hypothetical protein [Streptomyces sp. NPDC049555]|uniref:hypothetical protein n=1 Tax=Streptomyces sp. NPDC049555 TaxID=3154930 RepID=UPI00342C735D
MRSLLATPGTVYLLAVALLAWPLAGCAEPGGLHVAGPAGTPPATAGAVYVLEGPGQPLLRRPASLTVRGGPGRGVRLGGLRWRSWGGPTAEATGTATEVLAGTTPGTASRTTGTAGVTDTAGVTGTTGTGATGTTTGAVPGRWRVKVVLAGLVQQERSSYYGRATVVLLDAAPEPGPAKAPEELRDLRLFVPAEHREPYGPAPW